MNFVITILIFLSFGTQLSAKTFSIPSTGEVVNIYDVSRIVSKSLETNDAQATIDFLEEIIVSNSSISKELTKRIIESYMNTYIRSLIEQKDVSSFRTDEALRILDNHYGSDYEQSKDYKSYINIQKYLESNDPSFIGENERKIIDRRSYSSKAIIQFFPILQYKEEALSLILDDLFYNVESDSLSKIKEMAKTHRSLLPEAVCYNIEMTLQNISEDEERGNIYGLEYLNELDDPDQEEIDFIKDGYEYNLSELVSKIQTFAQMGVDKNYYCKGHNKTIVELIQFNELFYMEDFFNALENDLPFATSSRSNHSCKSDFIKWSLNRYNSRNLKVGANYTFAEARDGCEFILEIKKTPIQQFNRLTLIDNKERKVYETTAKKLIRLFN